MYSPPRPFSSTTRPILPVSSRFFLSSSRRYAWKYWAVKFGFLPDTVDAQHDGTSHGLLEDSRASVRNTAEPEIHADGHDPVGLVAPEHLVRSPRSLKILAGQPVFLQFLPS